MVKKLDPYLNFRDHVPAGENLLAQIAATARQQLRLEAEVAEAELTLSKAKEALRVVEEYELPRLMETAQQGKLTTIDGVVVEITDRITAATKKATEEDAFAYLEEEDAGDLVKNAVTIEFNREQTKDADRLWNLLQRWSLNPSRKRKKTVHPSTLKAWVRERLGEGEPVDAALLGVRHVRISKVSVPEDF